MRSADERRYDLVTVLLLMVGGLLAFVGWLVGVAMLWAGPRWTVREKLLGTLVWPLGPGGLLLASLLPRVTTVCVRGATDATGEKCTSGGVSMPSSLGLVGLACLLVTGAAVGLVLVNRAARPDRPDRGRRRWGRKRATSRGRLGPGWWMPRRWRRLTGRR